MLLDLKIALASLAAHKLRATLAMLGVFLGALAFNGVQHVAEAMYKNAEAEAEKLGPNLFAAMAGQVRFSRAGGQARVSGAVRNFTLADAEALAGGVPGVLNRAPYLTATMPIRSGAITVNTQITATWPAYTEIRSFRPELGRFVSDQDVEDRARVVVLGRKIAERLFGRPEAALGREVLIFRAGFTVVGVMEAKGRDLTGADQDEQTFVPLSTYMRRMANQAWITGVYLRLAEGADLGRVKSAATDILRKRHYLEGKKDDFSLLTPVDAMQLRREALDLVQTLGAITSTISFAVGGMGILSIMVLMVQARRVEIGIRRAVGGSRRDIVRQFLLEAGLMAGTGGALGALASIGLVQIVCALAGFPHVFDPFLTGLTLLGSALLGLAAGAYPARQAASIEILDVLSS
ncbi:MAG: ABC transporter permease [Proteobacteria bacterium]|nr:ABC transporter permease [Pseudomonadota bacterium]MBU1594861.1 ABC transporter permease [Pseudomonadota bacterium]